MTVTILNLENAQMGDTEIARAEFNKSGGPAGHQVRIFMRTGRNVHFAGPNVRHNFSPILSKYFLLPGQACLEFW